MASAIQAAEKRSSDEEHTGEHPIAPKAKLMAGFGKKTTGLFALVKAEKKQRVETGGEFRFAMDSGDENKVEALLEQGASANARVPSDPYTPLVYAIIKNRPDYVELLIKHDATVNAPDSHGKLPLHHAARMGQFPSVHLLLSNGANPTIRLTKGGWNVLHICAFEGFVDTVGVVLNLNPDLVHSKTDMWETPLHLAARAGRYRACDMLLKAGADHKSMVRGRGHQPLHEAVMRGHYKVVALLMRHGADPYVQEHGTTRRTALKLARDMGRNNCVSVMLGDEVAGGVEFIAGEDEDVKMGRDTSVDEI
jgi:ankyrin repeat protein